MRPKLLARQNVWRRAAERVGADLAAVHVDGLRLIPWAEWWVATLRSGRWWMALGASMRTLFWRSALEFCRSGRATEPRKSAAKLYRLAIYGRSGNRIGKKVIGRARAVYDLRRTNGRHILRFARCVRAGQSANGPPPRRNFLRATGPSARRSLCGGWQHG